MNQMKTGALIQTMRKEKGLTQEQFSEQFNVSRRTVSRWETGSNMPDLDIIIELSDFFGVSIRELLNGERKIDEMDNEVKRTALDVAEYSNNENEKNTKVVCRIFVLGMIALLVNQGMLLFDIGGTFATGLITGATFGISVAAMAFGIIYATKNLSKIRAAKKRMLKL